MRLHALLARLPEAVSTADLPDVEVLGVQEDSRRVRTGDLFIARQGGGADGKAFVADAHKNGAVAVVSDGPITDSPLPVVLVNNAGAAASVLANAALGDPSHSMKIVGVTGTNGKTTTTFILRHLLAKHGVRCGLIGTCEVDDGTHRREAAMTTPGPIALAEILATMRDKGCAAVAMEASSHALSQGRAAGVTFSAAGFTNLTGDHLDYHKSMDDYAAAKASLFASLPASAKAVINARDEWHARMLRDCAATPITFDTDGGEADYSAKNAAVRADGSHFILHAPDGNAPVHMRLVGRHNIQNALCAAAVAGQTFGLSVHQIAAGLTDAEGAPGRLQRVDAGQPFGVLIDYAHTDDALANVLSALKPITRGKLRVVFGCGGDRDRTKRPRMAAVAERFADAVYVTSDNPRTEDPAAILGEIVGGLSGEPALAEIDRRAAIRRALRDAEEHDDRAHRRQRARELPDRRHGQTPVRRRRRGAACAAGATSDRLKCPASATGVEVFRHASTLAPMIPLALSRVRGVLTGDSDGPEAAVRNVSTDTRTIGPGSLFVALRGQHFDGHGFLAQAKAAGAVAAVVDAETADAPLPRIVVPDTRVALGELANHVRHAARPKAVVAVAGSNGKTGTKLLIHAALGKHLRGSVSPKSFNNDVGVPLTLLAMEPDQDYVVVECGTNHSGEIENLSKIAEPDVAVITNCGPEHLEGLGDLDGVRRENAAIVAGMSPGGCLIVNGDDPRLVEAVRGLRRRRS